MEALRGVVCRSVRATKLAEGGCGLVDGILGVGKATPVTAVDEEDSHWEGWRQTLGLQFHCHRGVLLTISEDELCHTGNVHGDASEEVVVTAQSD